MKNKQQTFLAWLLTMAGGIALGLFFAALIACPLLLENSEISAFWGIK